MSSTTRSEPTVSGSAPRALRARTVALACCYAVLSAWALVQAHGIAELLFGSPPPRADLALAWSTVFKLLTLGGALVLAATGGRSVAAAQWLIAGNLAWVVPDVLVTQPGAGPGTALAGQAADLVIWLAPWLLLAPHRRRLVRPAGRPDALLLAVIAVAGGAFLWQLLARQLLARHGLATAAALPAEARFDVVGLGAAFVVVGLWAAAGARTVRWPAAVVGVAAVGSGLAALAWPHAVAAPGIGVAGGALAVGAVILARVLAPSRRRAPIEERPAAAV